MIYQQLHSLCFVIWVWQWCNAILVYLNYICNEGRFSTISAPVGCLHAEICLCTSGPACACTSYAVASVLNISVTLLLQFGSPVVSPEGSYAHCTQGSRTRHCAWVSSIFSTKHPHSTMFIAITGIDERLDRFVYERGQRHLRMCKVCLGKSTHDFQYDCASLVGLALSYVSSLFDGLVWLTLFL